MVKLTRCLLLHNILFLKLLPHESSCYHTNHGLFCWLRLKLSRERCPRVPYWWHLKEAFFWSCPGRWFQLLSLKRLSIFCWKFWYFTDYHYEVPYFWRYLLACACLANVKLVPTLPKTIPKCQVGQPADAFARKNLICSCANCKHFNRAISNW